MKWFIMVLLACIFPVTGIVISLVLRKKWKAAAEEKRDDKRTEKLRRMAKLLMMTGSILLVLALVLMFLIRNLQGRTMFIAAILIISLEYVVTMGIIIALSRILKKS